MVRSYFIVPLFGIIIFLALGPAPVAASSVIVCGTEIEDSSGAFSWPAFSQGRGNPHIERGDAEGLYEELWQLLSEQSIYWPEEIKSPVMKAITGLKSGVVSLTDFKITKDVSGLRARQFIFQHTPEALELPPNINNPDCQSESQKQALIAAAQYANLVERSGVEILSDAFKHTAEVTRMLEGVYDKYLFEGFAMYPWEALANSWLLTDKSIANGPPRNQLVLLHLAAGVVGATGSGSDTDIDVALAIEPIGWIRYTKEYDTWYGVSLLTVLPFDRDVGIGVAFNYNHFKLGITWHDYNNNNYDDPTIFLGLELYQFVDRNYRKYTSYKGKVEGILMNQK